MSNTPSYQDAGSQSNLTQFWIYFLKEFGLPTHSDWEHGFGNQIFLNCCDY